MFFVGTNYYFIRWYNLLEILNMYTVGILTVLTHFRLSAYIYENTSVLKYEISGWKYNTN